MICNRLDTYLRLGWHVCSPITFHQRSNCCQYIFCGLEDNYIYEFINKIEVMNSRSIYGSWNLFVPKRQLSVIYSGRGKAAMIFSARLLQEKCISNAKWLCMQSLSIWQKRSMQLTAMPYGAWWWRRESQQKWSTSWSHCTLECSAWIA